MALTLKPPPRGVTHWSARDLAHRVGLSHSTVHRIWQAHGIKPRRVETFKFSTDPHAEEKIRDIVGLYLNPPTQAVVLCIDEKRKPRRSTARSRNCPCAPGCRHDKRMLISATASSLYAALDVARGHVLGECSARHTTADFLRFLTKVVRHYCGELHVILGNSSTHKTPAVQAWAGGASPRALSLHPDGRLVAHTVEAWFSILTRKSIRRGSFDTVRALIRHITAYINHWNDHPVPFVWTKTAEDIIPKAVRH